MADQLKEFYRGAVDPSMLTGSQYATLLATDATTQAVIKDVVVGTNTFPATPTIQLDGLNLASLSGSVSGDQIVDVSSIVRLAFPSPLSFTSGQYIVPVSNALGISTISANNINGLTVKTSSTTQTASGLSNTIQGEFANAPDGDFFYYATDGNSSTNLHKRSGGPNGTQSNIETTSYTPKVFDGVRYYYYLSNQTTLSRFDIQTETVTNTTITSVDPYSSYPRLMFSNGYLCYLNSTGGYPYIIQASTGRWVRLTGFTFGTGGYSNLFDGFHFDPVTYNFTAFWYNHGNAYTYRSTIDAIGTFSSASATNGSAPTTIAFLAPSGTTSQTLVGLSRTLSILRDANGFPRVYTWSSTGITPAASSLSSYSTGTFIYKGSEVSVASPTAVDFPVSIDLGVYGVQVTP